VGMSGMFGRAGRCCLIAGRAGRGSRWPCRLISDHETIPLRDGETGPGKLSQGEYGSRVGARRILALLAERGIPATFFMPAVSALLHPDELRRYVADGHEVGMHGLIHERTMTLAPADERELALRSADVQSGPGRDLRHAMQGLSARPASATVLIMCPMAGPAGPLVPTAAGGFRRAGSTA
jgi:Polysaccharide deacetylase